LNNQENDRAFEPLFLAIAKLDLTAAEREKVIGNYMYMYEDKKVFAFKHTWTRQYVYLDDIGVIQDGVLNTGDFSSSLQDPES
jgi:hypothetical protein